MRLSVPVRVNDPCVPSRTSAWRAHAVRVAAAVLLMTPAACIDSVATVHGRTAVPLDSAFTVDASVDRAQTFAVAGPPGSGVYLEVSATGRDARVSVGDAVLGALYTQIGPDSSTGLLRSMTMPVPASGGLQVAVTVAVGSTETPRVTVRAHVDTSFDAARGVGRLLPGVVYGAGVEPCSRFGYVDLTAPFTQAMGARANDLSPVNMGFVYQGVLGVAIYSGTALWQPIPGVPAGDLEQGALTFQVLTSGRWLASVCGVRTPAKFRSFAFSPLPETVSRTVLLGDTVSGEAIDHVGDTDEFVLPNFAPNDSFFIAFVGGDRANSVLRLDVTSGLCCFVSVTSRERARPLLANTSPLMLGINASTTLFTVAGEAPTAALNRGPYRFAVLRFPSTRPELTRDTLLVGDTVATETLWTVVDRDVFVVNVAAGVTFTVQVRKLDVTSWPSTVYLERLTPNPINQVGGLYPFLVTSDSTGVARLPIGPSLGAMRFQVVSYDRSYLGRYQLIILPGAVP